MIWSRPLRTDGSTGPDAVGGAGAAAFAGVDGFAGDGAARLKLVDEGVEGGGIGAAEGNQEFGAGDALPAIRLEQEGDDALGEGAFGGAEAAFDTEDGPGTMLVKAEVFDDGDGVAHDIGIERA